MTNAQILSFWASVDSNNKGGNVCWDTVLWDIYFEYPECEQDKEFNRNLYKLIDSVEDQLLATS
jgi:hypothetical protein